MIGAAANATDAEGLDKGATIGKVASAGYVAIQEISNMIGNAFGKISAVVILARKKRLPVIGVCVCRKQAMAAIVPRRLKMYASVVEQLVQAERKKFHIE